MDLMTKYPDAVEYLKLLFGKQEVPNKVERLNEIHHVCENAWERNIENFRGSQVRYLLLAEAAPPPDKKEKMHYFYTTLDGPWVGRVLKTFFQTRLTTVEDCLEELAHRGFILIDSLPFAMPYSKVRKSPQYTKLVKSCSDYLMAKIQHPRIHWADDVKVALAFKRNGLSLINAFPDGLRLPTGQVLTLTEQKIAVDASYLTNSQLLRNMWGIQQS